MAYNEKSKQTAINYINENLEDVKLRVVKGEKAELVKESQNAGYSAYSRYLIDAVNEKAGRNLLTMPRERNAKKSVVTTQFKKPDWIRMRVMDAETLKSLPNEVVGRAYKYALQYWNDCIEPDDLTPQVKVAFDIFKAAIDEAYRRCNPSLRTK